MIITIKYMENESTIMLNQPIYNIGMLGSVSDGKSTCVQTISGTKTQRYSSEQTRNITIKPGYANAKIWSDGEKLYSTNSNVDSHEVGGVKTELVHHVSFVDCPGHHELILTMFCNIKLMNGVILVVGANEQISKKPQLIQHIAAIKIAGIENIIICLNKIDLVDKDTVQERYKELNQILRKYGIVPKIIIPTSFNRKIGINWLLEAIIEFFVKEDDIEGSNYFLASRSFDVNKPGTDWEDLKGGVVGGSLLNGRISVGNRIEIRPGICSKDRNGNLTCKPIKSDVLSLETEKRMLNDVNPGGLFGIGTNIDPYYCRNDFLSGNIIGIEGELPDVYSKIKLKYRLIDDFGGNWKPKVKDIVFLQINTMSISSEVTEFNKRNVTLVLSRPACIENSLIVISHKEDGIMKIVATGEFMSGDKIQIL